MIKKILLVSAIVIISGVLVFGGINRTLAQNDRGSWGNGVQRGDHDSEEALSPTPGAGNGTGRVSGLGIGRLGTSTTESGKGRGQWSDGYGRRNGAGTDGDWSGELYNLPPATPGELSADETAALLYMREEEKLAHDVYLALYSRWSLPIFQNISRSEQTHTDAVKALLDRYGLSDPASDSEGLFTNPDLQALYDDLAASGSQSLAEALKVGAAIEEIDILDLQQRLSQVDNADIQQVFNNLMSGSNNHLRAFVSTLNTQTGETYQPQYLSVEAYQAIIGASTGGSGSGYGGGNGGGGNGGGYRGGRP